MKRRTHSRIRFQATDLSKDINKKESGPGVLRMAGNFFRDMFKSAKSGFKRVSKEEHNRRLTICRSCHYLINKGTKWERCRHEKCGCVMQWKSRLESLDCPEGFWEKKGQKK